MARRIHGAGDLSRVVSAGDRPGTDTRNWVSLAIIRDFAVDPDHGVFVDITLIPGGDEETARVGAIYSGPGFGFYAPLEINDEILVVAPDGDPANGLVVVSRLWSASDTPPREAGTDVNATPTADVILVVKSGRSLNMKVSGGGNIVLNTDTGKVYLGQEDGSEPVALGQTLSSHLSSVKTWADGHVHIAPGGATGRADASVTGSSPTVPDILADKANAK